MTTRAAQLLVVAGLVGLAGCASSGVDPAGVEVVRRPAVPPDPSELARVLRLSAACDPPAGEGPWELWVPLPTTDRWQVVRSLAFEVAPAARWALETDAEGARLLHVHAPAPAPVAIRAEVERPATPAPPPLPAALAGLAADLDPGAWVEAAAARGVKARVALGVAVDPAGAATPRRWPEVLVEGAWTPVDGGRAALPPDRVRLGAAAPRATLAGQPAAAPVTWRGAPRRPGEPGP